MSAGLKKCTKERKELTCSILELLEETQLTKAPSKPLQLLGIKFKKKNKDKNLVVWSLSFLWPQWDCPQLFSGAHPGHRALRHWEAPLRVPTNMVEKRAVTGGSAAVLECYLRLLWKSWDYCITSYHLETGGQGPDQVGKSQNFPQQVYHILESPVKPRDTISRPKKLIFMALIVIFFLN